MKCKSICGGRCTAFNIKKFEFKMGFGCRFFKSVVDYKGCIGDQGHVVEPETTFMKYDYGDCKTKDANSTTKDICCNEADW